MEICEGHEQVYLENCPFCDFQLALMKLSSRVAELELIQKEAEK